MLIQLAISRKREFLADASGALLTRYPEGLASALEKISNHPAPLKRVNKATAHLYISSPLKIAQRRNKLAWQIIYDPSADGGKSKSVERFRNKIIFINYSIFAIAGKLQF